MARETALPQSASAEQNTQFTTDEVKEIKERLVEIEEYVVRIAHLEEEDRDAVHARLDYLANASTRMGRKDFLHIAIGVFFSVVITVGIPPDAAREWMAFAADQLIQGVGFAIGSAKQWFIGD